MILFVSPHLDDIALSCGGLVTRLAARGAQIVVASVCTADRPDGQSLSEAAQHVHWEWQLGDDRPYRHRRAEDEAACRALGAQALHLGLLDAIYRHDDAGQPLYTHNFIGGEVQPHDWQYYFPQVKDALRTPIGAAQRVYCPLGIGGHVDHVLVRAAVEELTELGQVAYYEDYPYAAKTDWQSTDVTAGLVASPLILTEAEVEARIAAIGRYPSQQFALFERAETMPERVRNYVVASGGERYWFPIDAHRDSY